jgi:hypothetical protein
MVTTIVAPTTTVPITNMGYNNWWMPCGCVPPDVEVAYAAKGASSFASSKINLANPGTNNAVDGGIITPTWDAVNGWLLGGNNANPVYLTTGLIPQKNWTYIMKVSIIDLLLQVLFGSDDGLSHTLGITTYYLAGKIFWSNPTGAFGNTVGFANGVLALAGDIGYINGNVDATGLPDNFDYALEMFIGVRNTNGVPNHGSSLRYVYWNSFAAYNKILSQAQVQEVGANMP